MAPRNIGATSIPAAIAQIKATPPLPPKVSGARAGPGQRPTRAPAPPKTGAVRRATTCHTRATQPAGQCGKHRSHIRPIPPRKSAMLAAPAAM